MTARDAITVAIDVGEIILAVAIVYFIRRDPF
jgi:hypothetical protein